MKYSDDQFRRNFGSAAGKKYLLNKRAAVNEAAQFFLGMLKQIQVNEHGETA